MESTFFVTTAAFLRIQPNLQLSEAGLRGDFDTNLDCIHAAAARIYSRGRKGSYDLTATDF